MTRQVIVTLVSKGRLRKESLNIFKRKKIVIKSEKGERDLIGYGKYKNHGWFTAYYPFNAPRIAITVFAEHGDSGGRAGGPIIKKIVSYYKENYGEKSDELR